MRNKANTNTIRNLISQTGLQIPYGWSTEGLETFSTISQKIQTDRAKHGAEFDKAFKEAMKEEVENEQKNQKRKGNGIEVYDDLNKERWNTEERYNSEEETKETWAAKNLFQL